jgi:hypothetical protein
MQGGKVSGPGREDLKAMLSVTVGLRDHVKALLRAKSAQLGAVRAIMAENKNATISRNRPRRRAR